MNKAQKMMVLVFGLFVLVNIYVVLKLGQATINDTGQQIAQIEKAVKHAAVQCYALEGSYPGKISYLEEHYGVTYDKKRFFIHYRYEGANFLPQIIVFTTFSETD